MSRIFEDLDPLRIACTNIVSIILSRVSSGNNPVIFYSLSGCNVLNVFKITKRYKAHNNSKDLLGRYKTPKSLTSSSLLEAA